MAAIELDRTEALDIYVALVEAEDALRGTGEVGVLLDLDGAIRIMFGRPFGGLRAGDEEG